MICEGSARSIYKPRAGGVRNSTMHSYRTVIFGGSCSLPLLPSPTHPDRSQPEVSGNPRSLRDSSTAPSSLITILRLKVCLCHLLRERRIDDFSEIYECSGQVDGAAYSVCILSQKKRKKRRLRLIRHPSARNPRHGRCRPVLHVKRETHQGELRIHNHHT